MAVTGQSRRRINLFSLSSTTPQGAGPYDEVFEALSKRAPFEISGAFERKIRVNHVENFSNGWFIELYLMIDRLDVLEVSAEPDAKDQPNFLVPNYDKSFASRTCAVFRPLKRMCAIEYVRSGPKSNDFMEVLSRQAELITRKSGTHFAINPMIEPNFIDEIGQFERIRQVRAVFERPNPGWGDVGILSGELEDSGDSKREVVLTAPRSGSIRKNRGLLKYLKTLIHKGTSPVSNIIIAGRRTGEAGETTISSHKSEVKRIVLLPITDNEQTYRREFLKRMIPIFGLDE
jgi:hypothetical protein